MGILYICLADKQLICHCNRVREQLLFVHFPIIAQQYSNLIIIEAYYEIVFFLKCKVLFAHTIFSMHSSSDPLCCTSGGPAARCDNVKVGDKVISVSGRSTTDLTHLEAWKFLKSLPEGDVEFAILARLD